MPRPLRSLVAPAVMVNYPRSIIPRRRYRPGGVSVKPKEVKGAYSLSKSAYSLGGSLYTVTLNAVQSIPKGATLTLKFAVPVRSGGGK